MMAVRIDNVTQSEIASILELENKSEVERLIPLIIYLVVISVTGIIGNGFVCYIYKPMRNKSSSRWFIFFLGVVDLFLCVVVLPIEVVTTFQQFNFNNVIFCKVSAFFNVCTTIVIGFILVIIAIDRYRKVCTPHGWQIDTFKSKILSGVLVIAAIAITLPMVDIYKIYPFRLPNSDIAGSECSFRKEEKGDMLKFIYLGFTTVLCVGSMLTICVLYCCIGVAIKKHISRDPTIRYQSSSLQNSLPDTDDTSEPTVVLETASNDNTDSAFTASNMKASTVDADKFRHNKSVRIKMAQAKKATYSMFLISLAAVICYIPLIGLVLARNLISDFHANLSNESRAVYKFFLRFVFTSCAVNPFMYGISDSKFRRKCKDVCRSLKNSIFCCCRHRKSVTL